MTDDPFAINRRNWDDRAAIHFRDDSGFYGVADFLAGADKLQAIEAAEIGDVRGLAIAHLQCHFGLDTLALARRGARCVGLDFSPVAITAARELQAKTGLDARFVEGNVYDARALIEGEFDLVYVTWGAIGWLPDVGRWAKVAASLLKPGGALYLLEGHPFLNMLDEKSTDLKPAYDWRTPVDKPLIFESDTSYTGDGAKLAHPKTCEWLHPLSDVVNAVIGAGLRLEWLREHEILAWPFAPMMVPAAERGMWRLPDGFPKLPLAFSVRAVRA